MKDRPTLLTHIYRLKLIIMGLAFVLLGLAFSLVADWLATTTNASHLLVSILRATSDVLLVTGAIGIAVDFFTGRDKEAADTERLRTVLKDAAPDIRDAVVAGFAETPDNMRGVATTETLDKLATNALALRLGDTQFASEIYADVRDQAVRAAERWHDVDVSIRLSAIAERETGGLPQFDVTVKWEYTVVPAHAVRRSHVCRTRTSTTSWPRTCPAHRRGS